MKRVTAHPDAKNIIAHFEKIDPIMAALAIRHGIPGLKPRKNHFQSLVREIIAQQISTKAADTIEARFRSLFPGTGFPSPQAVLAVSEAKLRAAGISGQKISYIKELARLSISGELRLAEIAKLTDEEIIENLVRVRGIGVWTAEMFLIFSLGREDIFSFGDNGLANAIKRHYNLRKFPSKKTLQRISSKWRPYRSIASRILWLSLDVKNK